MTEWRQIRVRKWHDFQHYKKRRPPWIKLHTSLLHKDEWMTLSDADKVALVSIWLLWAENYPKDATEEEREVFSLSSRVVQTRLSFASGHVHRCLDRLVQADFLEYVQAPRMRAASALSTEDRESPLKAFSSPNVKSMADPPLGGGQPSWVISMSTAREKLRERNAG